MKLIAAILLLVVTCVLPGYGQGGKTPSSVKTPISASDEKAATDLAKAALAAHGGEKLKQLKSLVMRGSVDITTSAFNQSIASTFVTVISGEKYNYELNNPFQPLKQVFDGKQTFSSLQGFSLPPITSLGFPLLPRIGDTGYVISPLTDEKKKKSGFRITTPEGYYTDFSINEKTSQIKGYESSYEYNGRLITTSVVVDQCLLVDGVLIPERYSQRFDLGQLTAYAAFKSKVILVNSTIEDSVFAMPN